MNLVYWSFCLAYANFQQGHHAEIDRILNSKPDENALNCYENVLTGVKVT